MRQDWNKRCQRIVGSNGSQNHGGKQPQEEEPAHGGKQSQEPTFPRSME